VSAGGWATRSNVLAAGASSSDVQLGASSAGGEYVYRTGVWGGALSTSHHVTNETHVAAVPRCAQPEKELTADPADGLESSGHWKLTRWSRV
jgi:hypothetical protein